MASSNSKIVIDTNMLLAITQFKADIFCLAKERFGRNIEFFVPKAVARELEEIAEKGRKQEKEVKLIKEVMDKNNVRVVETEAGRADDAIIELAGQGFITASNDKALRKRIKIIRANNIYLKQKKLIEIE